MHILIGVLTTIAALVWALNRLQDSGVNLNAFNPFWWYRRHQWQKKFGTKPLHTLKRPLEAAAVLLVASVKAEGDMSREQKQALLAIFRDEFGQDATAAADLLGASVYLLKDVMDVCAEVPHILAPSRDLFSAEQASSLLNLLDQVSRLEGAASESQRRLIDEVGKQLLKKQDDRLWS